VARVLAADGRFEVIALVRDEARARIALPAAIRLIRGDVRDAGALDAALSGAHAVYCNFNTPFNPKAVFDPDRDGTALVLAAAQRAGVRRFARISAMGVPEARDEWWSIGRKAGTDESVMSSGIAWTIFRPTWLMESLPLFVRGALAMQPRVGPFPIWWIAGEDYGRQVAAALASPAGENRVIVGQGPEGLSVAEAVRRFARALPRRTFLLPVPGASMRLGAMLSHDARYFMDLVDMSRRHTTRYLADATDRDFGKAAMRIEDYAASIARTGDWPRK
jgi:uncharacterized protein YbjT (DUF2867 family)